MGEELKCKECGAGLYANADGCYYQVAVEEGEDLASPPGGWRECDEGLRNYSVRCSADVGHVSGYAVNAEGVVVEEQGGGRERWAGHLLGRLRDFRELEGKDSSDLLRDCEAFLAARGNEASS